MSASCATPSPTAPRSARVRKAERWNNRVYVDRFACVMCHWLDDCVHGLDRFACVKNWSKWFEHVCKQNIPPHWDLKRAHGEQYRCPPSPLGPDKGPQGRGGWGGPTTGPPRRAWADRGRGAIPPLGPDKGPGRGWGGEGNRFCTATTICRDVAPTAGDADQSACQDTNNENI